MPKLTKRLFLTMNNTNLLISLDLLKEIVYLNYLLLMTKPVRKCFGTPALTYLDKVWKTFMEHGSAMALLSSMAFSMTHSWVILGFLRSITK